MSDVETGNESDVSTESTASSESASSAQTQDAAPSSTEAAPATEVPFHEHPRFKELVEQKNKYSQEAATLSEQNKQLYARMSQIEKQYQTQSQPKPANYEPLFDQIKQVNPEFYSFMKDNYTKAQQVEILQQDLQQLKEFQSSYQQQQALSTFDKLCTDNKVDPDFKDLYREAVANAANARGSDLSALPGLFKETHDRLSKVIEARDRKQRESYVAQKTQDKTPIAKPGGPSPAPRSAKGPISQDDVKAQLAAAIRARSSA